MVRLLTGVFLLLFSFSVLCANAAPLVENQEQIDRAKRAFERGVTGSTLALAQGLVHQGTTSHLGQSISRFQFDYQGLPIFFQTGSVQLSGTLLQEQARRISSGPLSVGEFNGEHPFPNEDTVLAWVLEQGFEGGVVSHLGWLVTADGRLMPVVRVDIPETGHLESLSLYLHGDTGIILHTEPLCLTQEAVLEADAPYGAVYLDNPVTTPDVALVPLQHLFDDTVHLTGEYARVESCIDLDECKESKPLALRSDIAGAEFVYEPLAGFSDEPDPFAEVNAYRNISAINSWLRYTFGFSALFGENPWILVKVGRIWDNAGYYRGSEENPPMLMLGRGTEEDPVNFAYDADTSHHEFIHAVMDQIWDHRWYSRDSFGINISNNAIEEAMADLGALAYSGDPALHGYVVRSRTGENSRTCPDGLVSEPHYEAEILTGFGWDVAEAIGVEPFSHILYRSWYFLSPSMTFRDFVFAIEDSAKDLAKEGVAGVTLQHLDILREKAEERGLMETACLKRLVPMEEKAKKIAVGYGNLRTNKQDFPFGLQWEIVVPKWDETQEAIQSFQLFLSWYYPEEDVNGLPVQPGYRVHIRRGEPVEVIWHEEDSVALPGEPAFDVVADLTVEGSPTQVSYPFANHTALQPDEPFYVLLSADHGEPIIAVEGEVWFSSKGVAPPKVNATGDGIGDDTFTSRAGNSACSMGRASEGKSNILQLFRAVF